MGVGENNPAIGETECCANCSKRAVFQPVVDIESLGVSIMHYVADFVEQMTALPAMKKSRGDDVHHNNVFIIINTNKKTVTSRELLTEFNINKVPCPRCRYRADKIHNMLKNKLDVGIGDISGICDHCKDKLTQEPCSICKDILKKFLDTSDTATKTIHRPMSSVKVPKLEEKYYLSEGRPKSATEFNIELKVIMQPEIETGSSKPARLAEKVDIPTKPFKIIMQPEIETGSFKPARLSEQFDNATKPSKVIRQPEIETESFKAGLSEKLDIIPTKPLQEKRRYTPKTRKSSPDESVITTFLTSFSKPDKDIKGNLPLNEYIFPQVIKKEAITKAALTTSSELIIKTQEKLYKDAKKEAKKLLKEKPSTVSSVEFIEKIRRDIETSKLGEAEDDLRRKQLKEKSSIESSAELETNVGEFKLGTQKEIKGEVSKDISKAKDEHELGQEKEGDRKIGAVGKSHSKDTKDILKEKDKLRQEKEGGRGKDAMGKPHSKDMKDISNAKDKYKLGQEKGDDREKEAVGKTKSKDMKDILMVKDKHKLGPEIEGDRAKVTVGKPHSEDMKAISKAKDKYELGQEKGDDREKEAVGKTKSKDMKDILMVKDKHKLGPEIEGDRAKVTVGKPHSEDMKAISKAKDKYELGQEKDDDRGKEAVGKTKSKDTKDMLKEKDKHKFDQEKEGERGKEAAGKTHTKDMKDIKAEQRKEDLRKLSLEKQKYQTTKKLSPPSKGKIPLEDIKDISKAKDKHKLGLDEDGDREKGAVGKLHSKDMKDIKAKQRIRKPSLEEVEKQKYQTTKTLLPPPKGPPQPMGKIPLEDIKDISKAKDKHKLGQDEDGYGEKGAVGKTKSRDIKDIKAKQGIRKLSLEEVVKQKYQTTKTLLPPPKGPPQPMGKIPLEDIKDISKAKDKHKLGQDEDGDGEKGAVGKTKSKDMKDIKAKQGIRKLSLEEVEKQKYQTTKTLLPPPKGPPQPKGKIPLEDIKDISKAKDKHKLGQDEDGDREKGAVGKTKSKEMKDISKGKHTITHEKDHTGKDEVKEKPQVETKKTDKSGILVQEERVKLAHSHALTEAALRTKDMAESMLSKAREKMMKRFDFGKELDARKHNLFKLEVVVIMYRLLEDTVKKNKKVKDFLNLRLFTQLSTAAAGDLILKLIKLSNAKRKKERKLDRKHKAKYRIRSIKQLLRHMDCCIESLSIDSSTILDIEDLINPKYPQKVRYKIKHTEIVRNIPDKPMPKMQVPDTLLFHTVVKEEKEEETLQVIDLEEDAEPQEQKAPMSTGILRYQLSDRSFIRKGWTKLPTEKIVRKLNIYKVRPTNPEFDWFNHNKKKGSLQYCTGETLAKFDEDGRGRLYYKNGLLALDYYDCEEANAQQRFVVYSSGESSERCRSLPVTVLAMFDYLGSGVVFDHTGKIRVKYNQTEGVVLDRGIGPEARWKWHTLNDPPVLKQVMIDTCSEPPDSTIMKLGAADKKEREVDETMLQIELNNVTKEKQRKTNQKFQPFQISMKSLKINDQFSLKIMDQAHVYLTFKDGSTHIKINLGMVLDSHEIIDTDTADYNDVAISLEQNLPKTESLIELQNKIKEVRRCENMRARYNETVKPTVPVCRADRVIAAVSKPLRPPLATCPQIDHATMDPLVCNLFYGTRFI